MPLSGPNCAAPLAGWTGADCGQSRVTCYNGGVVNSDNSACWCPLGTFGSACDASAQLSRLAQASADTRKLGVQMRYPAMTQPPTQQSFVAIFPAAATDAFQYTAMTYLCGGSYNAGLRGGLCGKDRSVELSVPVSVELMGLLGLLGLLS